jgi:hypothetical protein
MAAGLARAAQLTAGPAHAQRTPIVPDLSGKVFDFHWYDSQASFLHSGTLVINGVDVYTGNFAGFLQDDGVVSGLDSSTGTVTGQFVPSGLRYDITFTVSSPTDLWTYAGELWVGEAVWTDGVYTHTDPRDAASPSSERV